MNKISEAELTKQSVQFAGKYVEEKFKNGSLVEKSLVVNSLAHGFYIGARHQQKSRGSLWARIVSHIVGDDLDEAHALKAANYYLKKKGYTKLEFAEQALIRACVATGFRNGAQIGK